MDLFWSGLDPYIAPWMPVSDSSFSLESYLDMVLLTCGSPFTVEVSSPGTQLKSVSWAKPKSYYSKFTYEFAPAQDSVPVKAHPESVLVNISPEPRVSFTFPIPKARKRVSLSMDLISNISRPFNNASLGGYEEATNNFPMQA